MDNNIKSGIYIYNGKEIDFNFKTNLRTTEKIQFVNAVCSFIIDDDNKNYHSVLRDLIFDYEIVDIFTDVDVSNLNDAGNTIGAIEDFLSNTNIVDIIIKNVDVNVIRELNDAVNKNIEYKTGVKVASIEDSLSNFLDVITKKIENIDIDEFNKAVTKLGNSTGSVLTPEELLKAYSKTDMFKNKLKELNKEKEKNDNVINLVKR